MTNNPAVYILIPEKQQDKACNIQQLEENNRVDFPVRTLRQIVDCQIFYV